MRRPQRNGRSIRLAIALTGFGIAIVALIGALAILLTAPVSPIRARAPFDGVKAPQVSYTPVPTCPPGTRDCRYVELAPLQYVAVDYPLQLRVNAADTVTLTVSVHDNLLTLGPSTKTRGVLATAPVALPGDTQDYRDIGVIVRTVTPASSGTANPIVWQLIGPARESLLARRGAAVPYVDAAFTWRVSAVAPGPNVTSIAFSTVLQRADGSETTGPGIETDSPIPIMAVQPQPPRTQAVPLLLVSALSAAAATFVLAINTIKLVREVFEYLARLPLVKSARAGMRNVAARLRARHAGRARASPSPPAPRRSTRPTSRNRPPGAR